MHCNRKFSLYIHTNKINNKKYIGITTKNPPSKRWCNGKGYGKNSKINKAINKYGWDSFNHEILFCNLTKEQAELLEIEIIKYYKTQEDTYGYNIKSGGNHFEIDDNVKKKLSIKNKGRKLSKNARQLISKKVVCINNDIVYDSISEASKKLSIDRSSISACCRKKILSVKGYIFIYYDEYILNNKMTYIRKPKTTAKKVVCINSGIIYDSLKDASIATNGNASRISMCCRGLAKTNAGLHWMYFNE